MSQKEILIALVPAIHVNYLKLFQKYPEHLYVLGESLLSKWERHKNLERDLRKIDQNLIADFIIKSELVKSVDVLEEGNLDEVKGRKIVMPDEDVSHWFAKEFLKGEKIEFENIFLRWNRPVSTQELEVSPDRKITEEAFHKEMIEKAEKLAEKSANWWRQIAALAVKDGKVIAEGFNRRVPTQQNFDAYGDLRMCFDAGEHHELCGEIHAEMAVVAGCARKGIVLEGADLYVTTFPCPTCAKSVAESGIKNVYYKDGYSISDAEDILKNAEVELILVK